MEKDPRPMDEAALVAFVCPLKRQRVRGMIQSGKWRAKFVTQLRHFADWDPRSATKLDPSQQRMESILRLLQEKGASVDCYVVSASAELDQRSGVLATVLREVVGYRPGTIVSCMPGRLAYFEGEARNERYILERRESDS